MPCETCGGVFFEHLSGEMKSFDLLTAALVVIGLLMLSTPAKLRQSTPERGAQVAMR